MLTAEVSVYPLKTTDASGAINHSIEVLKGLNVSYTVDSMKTRLTGSSQDVFEGLQTMFKAAQNAGGEVSMVVTVTNAVS